MITKLKNKRGISLILLVITIIVLGVLAATVVTSISNSNIMTKAKESTFKTDMRQFQEAYSIWYASTAAENQALPGLTINAAYDSNPNSLYQEIFGSSVPTQYREGLKVEDGRVVYYTTDADRKVLLTELGMSPNALQITNTLTNCTNSNSAENIEYGEKYEGVLTPAPGYTIQNVCITMGGVDITSTAYSLATGAISISNVTGKIIINATTEQGTYTINNSLTYASTNNSNTQATGATSYSAVLSPNAGYTLTGATVTITMGGVDITSTAYTAATGAISISSVTGNVVISASMPAAAYTVTNNLTGCTSSNATTSATGATSYTATLTANTGKQLSSVTVTMGGVDVTSTYYNTSTHVVSIVSVTGDIVITATTSDITYTVTYTLTDVTKSSGSISVNYGASLSATVAASSGYKLPDSITVTIGGSNYAGFTYTKATGSISIPTNAITGNVVITVTGESTAVYATIKNSAGTDITLKPDNVKYYYGTEVSNYTVGDATYRLFFVDFYGQFGTAGTVYLKADYDSSRALKNQYSEKTSSTLKIDQMNPLWAAERGTSTSVTWNKNERGAAYLCDTSQWTTYLDSTKADFAIGSPSVEMFVASYNQVPHTVGNNTLGAVYSASNSPGYKYTVNGGSAVYYTSDNTIDRRGYHYMYAPINGYYWFSSPSSTYSNYLCDVLGDRQYLLYDNWENWNYGVCPVVSLKSSFQAILVAD